MNIKCSHSIESSTRYCVQCKTTTCPDCELSHPHHQVLTEQEFYTHLKSQISIISSLLSNEKKSLNTERSEAYHIQNDILKHVESRINFCIQKEAQIANNQIVFSNLRKKKEVDMLNQGKKILDRFDKKEQRIKTCEDTFLRVTNKVQDLKDGGIYKVQLQLDFLECVKKQIIQIPHYSTKVSQLRLNVASFNDTLKSDFSIQMAEILEQSQAKYYPSTFNSNNDEQRKPNGINNSLSTRAAQTIVQVSRH